MREKGKKKKKEKRKLEGKWKQEKKEERKLKGGDINGKLKGEGELEERKNLKKENVRNMKISLGVGQWKATHAESKKKNLTLNLKKNQNLKKNSIINARSTQLFRT